MFGSGRGRIDCTVPAVEFRREWLTKIGKKIKPWPDLSTTCRGKWCRKCHQFDGVVPGYLKPINLHNLSYRKTMLAKLGETVLFDDSIH